MQDGVSLCQRELSLRNVTCPGVSAQRNSLDVSDFVFFSITEDGAACVLPKLGEFSVTELI